MSLLVVGAAHLFLRACGIPGSLKLVQLSCPPRVSSGVFLCFYMMSGLRSLDYQPYSIDLYTRKRCSVAASYTTSGPSSAGTSHGSRTHPGPSHHHRLYAPLVPANLQTPRRPRTTLAILPDLKRKPRRCAFIIMGRSVSMSGATDLPRLG